MLSYLKGNLRDSTSWIISVQNAEREHLLQNTLSDVFQANGELAFFFCDLDNFGKADKALGHQEGAVGNHDFKTGEIKLGIKVGISLLGTGNHDVSYSSLETRAEKATWDKKGEPQRGRARLHVETDPPIPLADNYQRELAVCVVRSNVASKKNGSASS
jgi:hypothetical protein